MIPIKMRSGAIRKTVLFERYHIGTLLLAQVRFREAFALSKLFVFSACYLQISKQTKAVAPKHSQVQGLARQICNKRVRYASR
jgi:hypothetical protein